MIPGVNLLIAAWAVSIKGGVNATFVEGVKPFFHFKKFVPAVKFATLFVCGFNNGSKTAVATGKDTL